MHRGDAKHKCALPRTVRGLLCAPRNSPASLARPPPRAHWLARGGSLPNLWIEGFGRNGLAQASSVTTYKREEKAHMPGEGALLPLTTRLECTVDGTYDTNLFEADGGMNVSQETDPVTVTTTGPLRSATGADSGVTYRITHRFYRDHPGKEYVVTSPHTQTFRLVEPFVNDRGTVFSRISPQRVSIQPAGRSAWMLDIAANPGNSTLSLGTDAAKSWCPFPAVDCYPVTLEFTATAHQPATAQRTLGPR